jgi:hypothetical protein
VCCVSVVRQGIGCELVRGAVEERRVARLGGAGGQDGMGGGIKARWWDGGDKSQHNIPLYTTPEFNFTVTALLMISPRKPLGSLPSPCCGAPPFSIFRCCCLLLCVTGSWDCVVCCCL